MSAPGRRTLPASLHFMSKPGCWKLNPTEGYRLSKPVGTKVTHLLYVDDLKVFASSESKLNRALRSTSTAMQDMGLQYNPKKCNVIYVRKGKQVEDAVDLKLDETTLVANLKTGAKYVFLGVRESGQPLCKTKTASRQQTSSTYLS